MAALAMIKNVTPMMNPYKSITPRSSYLSTYFVGARQKANPPRWIGFFIFKQIACASVFLSLNDAGTHEKNCNQTSACHTLVSLA
jgi:hypothetical protein